MYITDAIIGHRLGELIFNISPRTRFDLMDIYQKIRSRVNCW
jgi:hypothetical protein